MIPARNKLLARFRLDGLIPPDQWSSAQAKSLYEAGVETEKSGAWSDHIISGTIKIALHPDSPEMCPYGTHPDIALENARNQAILLRAKADLIEKTLAAYGPEAFIVKKQAVECPPQPAEAEPFLMSILRRKWTNIWVNGVEFFRDSSRSAVRAPVHTPKKKVAP